MKLLIADNNDSFTWNLVQLAREAGADSVSVVKTEMILTSKPDSFDGIIFSPGPGLPKEFPGMSEILGRYPYKKILGICLGMQAIGIHFGGKLLNMKQVKHGLQIKVNIKEYDYIFKDLPARFDAGLYHSWALSEERLPSSLTVTAQSDDNTVMAIKHNSLDIRGVQFHPESIMTPRGFMIMKNWLGC